MAKYSALAQKKVKRAMDEMKEGKLKSGRSGKKVTNPKQAIAIGLSEAREEGAKVPKKSATKKTTTKRATAKKTTAKKSVAKKASTSRMKSSAM
jgi:topoisomerase IA-like protein